MESRLDTLLIQVLSADPDVISFYETQAKKSETTTDSGVDLMFPRDYFLSPKSSILVDFEIKCKLISSNPNGNVVPNGYFLMPRSSIFKSPLRQCNSIGLIDYGYRGNICVAVDNISQDNNHNIMKGVKLFQLVMPDAKPFKVQIVENIENDTLRGEGGFGSTDVQ